MAKPVSRAISRYTNDALALLGMMIRVARIERKMTIAELATRANISQALLKRIEEGDPGCSIGAAFEVAAIVGVPLMADDPKVLAVKLAHYREKLALLPKAARKSTRTLNDDF
ncbi:MAG: helix-turn-helix domain-containing protein [Gallionella sp.]|nr:helix-turn-helix domain-containing protein [Gallionella sp.]